MPITDHGYLVAQTRISDEAYAEKRAKWHEVYDCAVGGTAPLLHPDWRALWDECVTAGVIVHDYALVFADKASGGTAMAGMIRCDQRGRITLEG